ncbi:branched-chain amino acid ABC transporter permease [Thioclava atlantica]|uniref:High-affinity branched-chain amino acid transport system permease BraE n=1 Tax=Thioclava atlantica TaxID=1317124 RepID=A0A085TZY3_9RHOB|nr:branched-chain amino acid ABC transporter permease [Thioclava atlantica]KFE36280.1 high-affinity branched-chain amino acid transport system permease BraE [Thioclava atlantica]
MKDDVMKTPIPVSLPPLATGLIAVAACAIFGWLFLLAESEVAVLGLVLLAVLAGWGAQKTGLSATLGTAMHQHSGAMNGAIVASLLAVIALLGTEHFPLLMLSTMLLYLVAALGLNVQFGLTGMVNFAGAAFFGIGAYTSAVLTTHTAVPPLLILLAGGLIAALIGALLIVPVVRTAGHYSAVVTIAFGVLFKTFLEVNEVLGGPQGLMVGSMNVFGWDFNNGPVLMGHEMSFYVNYALLSSGLAILAFALTRRLERSWLGLALDSVRLDETASACFGINVVRAKVLAFTYGNILAGIAGALYGMMISFIAPNSFTFSDSLLMVSIVLLGGLGSLWGSALAAVIVVLVPEKLQILQEYRFLLFSVLVIAMLLFRPQGLLPRGVRSYFPGGRAQR